MDKKAIGFYFALLIASFLFGRHSAPEKIKIEKEIVTVEVEKYKVANQVETTSTVTNVDKPDGTRLTRTKITAKTKDTIVQATSKQKVESEKKEVISGSRSRVMALFGSNFASVGGGPVYGVCVERPILGPIVIGVWALTSREVGASLGFDF